MNPNDPRFESKNGSSGRPPTRLRFQARPDKDWYRKWQERLQQREKDGPR